MGKGKQLNETEKQLFMHHSAAGKSAAEIGEIICRPRATVAHFLKRARERHTTDATPRSGRPRATVPRIDRWIIHIVRDNRFMTARAWTFKANP